MGDYSGLESSSDSSRFPEFERLDVFLATEIKEPIQVIKGLLHQGSKMILGGTSKSRKTWATTDLAVSVAAGATWLGFETTAGKVLYANLEIQPFAYQRRLSAIITCKGLDPKGEWLTNFQLWNVRGYCVDTDALLGELESRTVDQGLSLIVIDPLYKLLAGRQENKAEDMNNLFSKLEQIATSTGAAVLYGSHFSKGNQAAKESIDRISGSGVIARDPDTIMTMTAHEVPGACTIEITLRNLPQVAPFVVMWEYPVFVRDRTLSPEHLKKPPGQAKLYRPDMVTAILKDQTLPKAKLAKLLQTEKGMSKSTSYKLLDEAERLGMIKNDAQGRWKASAVRITNLAELDFGKPDA